MTNEVARDRRRVYGMFYEAAEGLVLEFGSKEILEMDPEDGTILSDLCEVDEVINTLDDMYDQGVGCFSYNLKGLIAGIAICDAINGNAARVEFVEDTHLRQDYSYAQN